MQCAWLLNVVIRWWSTTFSLRFQNSVRDCRLHIDCVDRANIQMTFKSPDFWPAPKDYRAFEGARAQHRAAPGFSPFSIPLAMANIQNQLRWMRPKMRIASHSDRSLKWFLTGWNAAAAVMAISTSIHSYATAMQRRSGASSHAIRKSWRIQQKIRQHGKRSFCISSLSSQNGVQFLSKIIFVHFEHSYSSFFYFSSSSSASRRIHPSTSPNKRKVKFCHPFRQRRRRRRDKYAHNFFIFAFWYALQNAYSWSVQVARCQCDDRFAASRLHAYPGRRLYDTQIKQNG